MPRTHKPKNFPENDLLPGKWSPKFMANADHRYAVIREMRRRTNRLKRHCNADSYQKRILVERAVFLAAKIESMEVEALEGQKLDFGVYTQATNALSGLLSKLGLDKADKAPVKTMATIIGGRDA